MKANELMIGDWVQDITPVVIDAISNEDICTYRDEHGYITANPSNLKPIPLTAEILEKNEFDIAILNNKEPEAYLRMGYLNDDGEMEDVAYDIIIDHHKTYWELTIINNDKGCRIDININYVHQLQHALRLCGIDKEIVL